MLDKMKQLYELQKKAKEVQSQLRETEIQACSADKSVCVVFNGEQKIVDIKIDEAMLQVAKKVDLEQLLVKVTSEAIAKTQSLAAEKTKDVMKEMGLNIPGMWWL